MRKRILTVLAILAVLLSGVLPASAETVIVFSGSAADISGGGAEEKDGRVKITSPGVYVLRGSGDCAGIVVDAGKKAEVTLVLDGVNLFCPDGSVIEAEKMAGLTVMTGAGTENLLVSGAEGQAWTGEEKTAVILCRCPLVLDGEGMLTVKGYLQHGIRTTKACEVRAGGYDVSSAEVALFAKGALILAGGAVSLSAGGDGIRAGDEDAGGEMLLSGASVSVTAAQDGIQCEAGAELSSGTLTVLAGIGGNEEAGGKGVKTAASLILSGADVTVDAADDALHAGGEFVMTGGTAALVSGDDAVHSDETVLIAGGELTVSRCGEGVEGTQAAILGGVIRINAQDDGINACGDADIALADAALNAFDPAADAADWAAFFSVGYPCIAVCGGEISIDAGNDGLDANGHILIAGGTLTVAGAANGKHGALDTGYENGGMCLVSGGCVLAAGSGAFDGASAQPSANIAVRFHAGDVLAVCLPDGTELMRTVMPRGGDSVLVSCEGVGEPEKLKVTVIK